MLMDVTSLAGTNDVWCQNCITGSSANRPRSENRHREANITLCVNHTTQAEPSTKHMRASTVGIRSTGGRSAAKLAERPNRAEHRLAATALILATTMGENR